MIFEYVGTEDGPDSIVFHGIQFSKGTTVDVHDDKVLVIPKTGRPTVQIKLIDKLMGNRCFVAVNSKPEPKQKLSLKKSNEQELI